MSKLDDKKRIKDIIAEVKSGLKDRLVSSGHMTALIFYYIQYVMKKDIKPHLTE